MKVELIVTNRVLDLIVDGIDLAIRAGPLKDSSLIAKRFDLGYFGCGQAPITWPSTLRRAIPKNWRNIITCDPPVSR